MNEDEKLFLAALHEDDTQTCLEILSAKKVSPNFRESPQTLPILFLATVRGNEEVVRQLLQMGANLYDFSVNVESPLYLASAYGYSNIVKLLLLEFSKRFEDFPKSKAGDSVVDLVLFIASCEGHVDLVNWALEYGANVDFLLSDEGLIAAVMSACRRAADCAGVLAGRSSLMLAIKNGHELVVDVLLKKGANPNLIKRSSLPYSEPAPQLQLFKDGRPNSMDAAKIVDLIAGTALFDAISRGLQINVMQQLLEYGADVDLTADGGRSPLMHAVLMGSLMVVRWLYEAGVSGISEIINTPDMVRICNRNSDVKKCLEFLESPPPEFLTKRDVALRERVKLDYFSSYEEIRRRGKVNLTRLVERRKMLDQQDAAREEKGNAQAEELIQYLKQVELLEDTQRKIKEDFAHKLQVVEQARAKERLELEQKIVADFAAKLEAEKQVVSELQKEQASLKSELSKQSEEFKQVFAKAEQLVAKKQAQVVEVWRLQIAAKTQASNAAKLEKYVAELEEKLMALQKSETVRSQVKSLRAQCEKNEEEKKVLQQKLSGLEHDFSSAWTVVDVAVTCPISFEVMEDPVVAADGITYERKLIKRQLSVDGRSPITRRRLGNQSLFPNQALHELINKLVHSLKVVKRPGGKFVPAPASEPAPAPTMAPASSSSATHDDGWLTVSRHGM